MKRIYFILSSLLIAISAMSYLYFSNLNTGNSQLNQSLKMVVQNATLIFSFQNNKSVVDILKGQELFDNLIGKEKTKALQSLRAALSSPELTAMIQDQNIYIGFYPGTGKNMELMLSVHINPETDAQTMLLELKRHKATVKPNGNFNQIQLADGSTFFLTIKDRVVLIATAAKEIESRLSKIESNEEIDFISFIQKNDRLSSNSLANLYINFKQLPALLNTITPYFSKGDLALLDRQQAFARLNYNFSKEKIYFSGETNVKNQDSYFSLFSHLKPEKLDLDKILPENTASFTLYAFGEFKSFHKSLKTWFQIRKEDKTIEQKIDAINQQYRLNLDDVFLANTGSQAITFQLENKQKLAAVKLTNGDKVAQLLLDLSDEYNGDIRLLKEPDLLYFYFGEPFKNFKQPYYLIINNYILFAPYASSLQDFKNHYQNNRLLMMDNSYADISKQLPLTSNILFYLNNERSQQAILNTVYPAYYEHYTNLEGLKVFNDFVYQLSGDEGSFQTNMLFNTQRSLNKANVDLEKDSLTGP
jgi:hypothetical protein